MSLDHQTIADFDPNLWNAIEAERHRQESSIELIASENHASRRVMQAQGSVLTNKYAEGYPGKRYYGGCLNVDLVEQLAIDRVKELFGAEFANVQPHSGAQANGAVMLALTNPGDTILGMALDAGGHLTHGARPAQSGKWFRAFGYGLTPDGLIDYDAVERIAVTERPRLIIAGASAYSRIIDFERFRKIADRSGSLLMVDMAHIAGLVATGHHPNPIRYADVVTSTTHKTLRGPRGGIILTNNADLSKKINSAVFPGLQGGPLMHVIAAKAVAFSEALEPEFKTYISNVVECARILADVLVRRGTAIVSGGTDNHLMLVDLRPLGVKGNIAADALERVGITCNKNGVPDDPEKPTVTSGIRLGTAAGCSRGFGPKEFSGIGELIGDILVSLSRNPEGQADIENKVRASVSALCKRFPVYG